MDESQFRDRICGELRKSFPEYDIQQGQNLLYKLFIDSQGKVQPSSFAKPRRGQLAFQTDILIKKDKVPVVAIETKFGGYSTHDVLTYSAKAMKHKEVYPYIRYGLIIGDMNRLHKKFFIHNIGFDFAIAMKDMKDGLMELVVIVKHQLQAAELMLSALTDKVVTKYVTRIELS